LLLLLLSTGQRITTAMYKYYSHKNQLSAAGNALLLARSFRQRLWDNSQQQVGACSSLFHPPAASIPCVLPKLIVVAGMCCALQAHADTGGPWCCNKCSSRLQ
jgi:hypothetical protein